MLRAFARVGKAYLGMAQDLLTTLLRLEGAATVGAANGIDALAVARRQRFDVVVIDFGLPDIPGEVLIRAILSAARVLPTVVVITGERGPSWPAPGTPARARSSSSRVTGRTSSAT
jgi:DNA-binding NarL/FixJ family response regulator